jgi:hypothetical protein
MDFLETIKERNSVLFWFGLINLILAFVFAIFSKYNPIELAGTNAWYKPVKFGLSIGIFSWTMAWYTAYLGTGKDIVTYNWVVVSTLGFEIIYIGLQAGRGMQSHFNLSTPGYVALYVAMALAATIVTLWTGYIGLHFFTKSFPQLPYYYLWAIRLGIMLFVAFSLEGFVMGARLSHTIGGADGGAGLPFLNWSRKYRDPRVAHFIGMHALQVLPLVSFYLLKNTRLTIGAGIVYTLLAMYVLVQALGGKTF